MISYAIVANKLAVRTCRKRFASYKMRGLTSENLLAWFLYFDEGALRLARRFLKMIRFVDAGRLQHGLIACGNSLMDHVLGGKVQPEEVLVVQVDSLASSAARAVTTFKRNARFGRDYNYRESTDTRGILLLVAAQQIKVVIYVDDFVGTGTQVLQARGYVMSALGVSVTEYVVAGVILEEALDRLELECDVRSVLVHRRCERPMLSECKGFSSQDRASLIAASSKVGSGHPLGFGQCASMVVLSDDVPDNAPALIRDGLFLSA